MRKFGGCEFHPSELSRNYRPQEGSAAAVVAVCGGSGQVVGAIAVEAESFHKTLQQNAGPGWNEWYEACGGGELQIWFREYTPAYFNEPGKEKEHHAVVEAVRREHELLGAD